MRDKVIPVCAALVFVLCAAMAIALYETGDGQTIAATTTPQRMTNFTANTVSVFNRSTNAIFTLANLTTNVMATRITAGTAIRVAGEGTYTFNANGNRIITSVCVATTNGVANVDIAAF